MPISSMSEMLADLPGGVYFNPFKLGGMVAVFTLWALYAQWVDKDTVRVNTYRTIWNVLTLVAGAVALVLLLFVPLFLAGLGMFALINGGLMIAYVVHRNGLVVEEDRVCTPAHIKRLMTEGFGSSEERRKKKLEVQTKVKLRGPDGKIEAPEEHEQRVHYQAIQDLLYDALYRHAQLIEILPAGQASKVRVSVDGVVGEREPLARADGDALLAFVKGMAGLDLEERRKPQKGKLRAEIGETTYDLIVRTMGSTAGERLAIRALGDERSFKIADIGFTEDQVTQFRTLLDADKGLVLFTSPPRGGLSTTMYSVIRSNDAFLNNIQTLEYEAEMDVENITQHVYTPSEEKTFSDEMARILRSDPDVVVVPETREKNTALMLSEAAARKANVYTGIHALDLFDGFRRWVQLIGDTALVSKSLTAIVHQRLIRKLCPACKVAYKPDPGTLKKLNLGTDKVLYRPPEPEYDKQGRPILCQRCHGANYLGRTGVFTVLLIDDEIRDLLRRNASMADIKSAALKKGGVALQQVALEKVFDGTTSIEEVVRATRPQQAGAKKGGTNAA